MLPNLCNDYAQLYDIGFTYTEKHTPLFYTPTHPSPHRPLRVDNHVTVVGGQAGDVRRFLLSE